DDGAHDIVFLPELRGILAWPFARAMIDMPIGLPDAGNRGCDEDAQALRGPHRTRVFLGARRWILDCATQAGANIRARASGQSGVSAQLFALSAKMREADLLARDPSRTCVPAPERRPAACKEEDARRPGRPATPPRGGRL